MKFKTFTLSVGCCLVAVGITVGQNSEMDSESESKVAERKGQSDASLTAEKWKRLEDTEKQVSVEIPGQPWETQTQEDLAEKSPRGGCRRGGQGNYIVTANHKKLKAFAYLSEIPKPFIFRQRKDLEDYLDKRRSVLEEKMSEDFKVLNATLNTDNGSAVYTLEFISTVNTGGGRGCRKTATANKKVVHYIFKDHFIRPEGQMEGRIFRLIGVALEEKAYPAVKSDLKQFVNSFRYTGNTADILFVPNAEESKIPSTSQGSPQMGTWLLLGAIILLTVYMFYKRSKTKE